MKYLHWVWRLPLRNWNSPQMVGLVVKEEVGAGKGMGVANEVAGDWETGWEAGRGDREAAGEEVQGVAKGAVGGVGGEMEEATVTEGGVEEQGLGGETGGEMEEATAVVAGVGAMAAAAAAGEEVAGGPGGGRAELVAADCSSLHRQGGSI